MLDIDTLLVFIPALPLAAAVLTAALGKPVLRQRSHWPAVAAIAVSFVLSILLVFKVHAQARSAAGQARPDQPGTYEYVTRPPLWTWSGVQGAYAYPGQGPETAQAPPTRSFQVDIALRADSLTAFMLATVTLISLLVAVYSIGYMHADPGYWRFFTYIALFVFSMTMLVSASNFLLLYVFWEAVGFCSYILIGFWYQRPAAAAAGKKAFLVNRVGDFGFALGVFLLWTTYGTLNFHDTQVEGILGQSRLEAQDRWLEQQEQIVAQRKGDRHLQQTVPVPLSQLSQTGGPYFQGTAVATAICLLLMLGACGKSAQFPLHVWLPDAMEGPTPVSALIHAATMVTAGVYMVARCMPLFLASIPAQYVVAVLGGFTAVLAAAIALTQTDLKRILAYSTISQLGYMFLGLGAATLVGVTAGMFHLFTHAFFKALLFLGAGSVMHAMGGVIDIRRFGGLRRRLPWTYGTFLVGCLALAGFPLLAGFFSKDQIFAAVDQKTGPLYSTLFWVAVLTAFLTAVYTFRAFFITFHGPQRLPPEAGDHARESPGSMVVPLVILAAGSALVGYLFPWVRDFLKQTPSLASASLPAHGLAAEHGSHWRIAAVSTAVVLAGIGVAAFLYLGRRTVLEQLTRIVDSVRLYRLSHGKFFFDELYGWLVVRPLEGIARLSYWVDHYVIDGLVDVCGLVPKLVGGKLRRLQNGMVQFYALAMVLGLLVLIGALFWF